MTARAARYGALLGALWTAHDLADHVVQTDHQAAGKAGPGWAGARAMAGHVGSYHAVQLAALLALRALDVRPSWRRTVAAVLLSAGTHALLDRRWPVRLVLELTGSSGFARGTMRIPELLVLTERPQDAPKRRAAGGPDAVWTCQVGTLQAAAVPAPLHGPYLADQALHHVVLGVCAAILAGGRP